MSRHERFKRAVVMLLIAAGLFWMFFLFSDYSGIESLFMTTFILVIEGIVFLWAEGHLDITIEDREQAARRRYERRCVVTLKQTTFSYPFKYVKGRLKLESKYREHKETCLTKWNISDEKIQTRETVIKLPCGYSVIHCDELWISDLFGFFCKKYKKQIEPYEIVVMPKYRKIDFKDTDIVALSGRIKALLPREREEEELSELKEWKEGEPLNRIHWKLSARTEEMMMRVPEKQSEKQPEQEVCIYVSLNRNTNLTKNLEYGYSIAYILMEQGLEYNICWYDIGSRSFRKEHPTDREGIRQIFQNLMRSDMYEHLPLEFKGQLGFNEMNEEKTFVFQI